MSGQPLRVWIVPPEGRGPAGEPGPRELADRLRERGVRPEILDIDPGRNAARPGETIRAPGLRRPWLRPLAARWLAGYRGTDLPDLIHVQGIASADLAIDLAETLHVPYLLELADFLTPSGRLRVGRQSCLGLIVPDADLAGDLTRAMGVAPDRVFLIPPGIPAVDPECARACRRVGHLPVIGAAGSAADGPGLAELIEAMPGILSALGDVELLIAGNAGDLPGIHERALARGVAERITYTGGATASALFWDALAIYCQAPTGPACGVRLALAMSRGIPAVASDVPGLRHWIEPGETGRLVPPGNPGRLATALVDLLNDPDEAARLGANAASTIARSCGPDRQADALADLYRRIVRDPAPRPWSA
ncbi:MAG: glycosyltransferase family 4 protein [Isosphaeraceae bacterium]